MRLFGLFSGKTKTAEEKASVAIPEEGPKESPEEKIQRGITEWKEAIPIKLRDAAEEFVDQLAEARLMLLAHQPLEEEKTKLRGIVERLECVIRVFQAGYNITTLNKEWFCGVIREEEFYDLPGYRGWRLEKVLQRFPSANPVREGARRLFTFQGIVPPHVQERYLEAREVFGKGHIQIYSPRREDFAVANIHVDPVMIGLVENVPGHGDLFFEIARWGTHKDLEAMESKEEE